VHPESGRLHLTAPAEAPDRLRRRGTRVIDQLHAAGNSGAAGRAASRAMVQIGLSQLDVSTVARGARTASA
jgi:hypothetical protein